MKTITFHAYDKTFSAEAEDGFSIMEAANKAIIWSAPKYRQGMWYEENATKFVWKEGNYFD